MRVQGTLSDWKERQGFGFITPDAGGERVFVHQSAFLNRKRQPGAGAQVIYELAPHKNRGMCASKVVYVEDAAVTRATARTTMRDSRDGKSSMSWFALAFLSLLAAATIKGYLPAVVLGLYLVASIVSFFAYAIDKSAARSGQWRTTENTLHLFDLIGGWPGGLLAQKRFRHKSSKKSFQVEFWLGVIINCAAPAWLFSAGGRAFLLQMS